VNLTQLRAFIAVVDRRSFSEAARALGVSQPAVTLQVQSLERELSATLLERRRKRIELTEAGGLLEPAAREIVKRWEGLAERISVLEGTVGGRLTVGGSTTPAHYVLPRFIGDLKRRYPDVAVVLEVADTRDTVERLKAGDLDVAVVGEEVKDRAVDCERWLTDELVVVAAPDSPLAKGPAHAVSELADHPIVSREKGSATRDVVEQHLASQGVSPDDLDVVMELGTSEAVASAVEAGLGLAIVSRVSVERSLALGRLVTADVKTFPLVRWFYMCKLKNRAPTRAAQAFVDHAHGWSQEQP
jgi:DNA-binding transcriptional LysR family regulator